MQRLARRAYAAAPRQVVFHDGFKLQFRSGETTSGCGSEQLCPNQFCPTNPAAGRVPPGAGGRQVAAEFAEVARLLARRATELAAPALAAAAACTAGPIARGFDRPGADILGGIGIMTRADGGNDTHRCPNSSTRVALPAQIPTS